MPKYALHYLIFLRSIKIFASPKLFLALYRVMKGSTMYTYPRQILNYPRFAEIVNTFDLPVQELMHDSLYMSYMIIFRLLVIF